MKLTKPLHRLSEHVERIFDSTAAVLRLQRKIPEIASILEQDLGKAEVSFCSNDYLNVKKYLATSKITHSVSRQPAFAPPDESVLHLERKLSQYYGRLESLVTPSIDHAIWSLFSSIVTPDDAVLIDTFSRPIVNLAARASRAKIVINYFNCDMQDLERKLRHEAASCRLKFIITDGYFELGSNVPPLVHLGKLVSLYEPAILVLIDNNNLGLLGPRGKGLEDHFNVEDLADVIIGGFETTLGLPPCGFATSSSSSLMSSLRHSSITYSRSPSLCPSIAHQALGVLDLLGSHETYLPVLKDLREKVKYFKEALKLIGFHIIGDVIDHPAITMLMHHPVGNVYKEKFRQHRNLMDTANHARLLHRRLYQQGVEVGCPLPPLVPFNGGRLKIDILASHSYEDLDRCLCAFEDSAQGLRGVLNRKNRNS